MTPEAILRTGLRCEYVRAQSTGRRGNSVQGASPQRQQPVRRFPMSNTKFLAAAAATIAAAGMIGVAIAQTQTSPTPGETTQSSGTGTATAQTNTGATSA